MRQLRFGNTGNLSRTRYYGAELDLCMLKNYPIADPQP
jgi:hypothetical protein